MSDFSYEFGAIIDDKGIWFFDWIFWEKFQVLKRISNQSPSPKIVGFLDFSSPQIKSFQPLQETECDNARWVEVWPGQEGDASLDR